MELWKPISGYETIYSVSNEGRIRRDRPYRNTRPGFILKNNIGSNGYFRVTLSKDCIRKDFLVHRIVANSFIGPCPPRHEVNHKNSIKTDNKITNLEYVTRSANRKHYIATPLSHKGSRHFNSKLTEADVLAIRKMYKKGKISMKTIGETFSVSTNQVRLILIRKWWKHI